MKQMKTNHLIHSTKQATSYYVIDNQELITAIEDANKKPVKVKVRDRTSEETKV